MKKQHILEGDWDNLIILDACRFDEFRRNYTDFDNLEDGELQKRRSRGSCTAEWLSRTFIDSMPDVVYYSTNPFVNSLDMPLRKTVVNSNVKRYNINFDWNPTEHFGEVVDLWETHWNKEYNTVLPRDVVEAIDRRELRRRIIHFVQPHQPYLGYESHTQEWQNRYRVREEDEKSKSKNKTDILLEKIKPMITPILEATPKKLQWQIKHKLGGSMTTIQHIVINEGEDELKKQYRHNLREVLLSVNTLLEDLESKTIITADHGESLGERGEWGHTYNTTNPILREVPWLIIEGDDDDR